jgi:uncharacterized protein YyaL (SSP411 family)
LLACGKPWYPPSVAGHLHFTSPQPWHRSFAEALAACGPQRCVLVQVGRVTCGGSRALVEKSVAKEEILEYLEQHYVCVSADADQPEPAVAKLIDAMPQKDRTPYCLFVGPDGALLHSTSGGRPPAVFLADLIQAQALVTANR